MEKQPKGLTFTRSYEPDKERMLRALRVLLESEPAESLAGEGDSWGREKPESSLVAKGT